MNWQQVLGQCALVATFILLAAFAASRLLQRTSAAWRHFLWTAVLTGVLALPALLRMVPTWSVKAAAQPIVTVETVIAESFSVQSAPAKASWNPLLLAWMAGCALVALRFAIGRIRAARMVRRAMPAAAGQEILQQWGAGGVRVLESRDASTALAAGIFRPAILLPSDAHEWPADRLRAALLHEWMHIQRRDLLAQAVAQAACCLYWYHPLAWLAARELRREREQACDDAVLAQGIEPQDYAGQLVESARAMRGRRSVAMAMAEPSELERRITALLDGNRDRRPLSRTAAGVMVAALAMVLLPVAAITVHAQAQPAPAQITAAPVAMVESPASVATPAPAAAPAPRPVPAPRPAAAPAKPEPVPQAASGIGGISGLVQDPSAARIPNAAVNIRNADGSVDLNTTTDSVGAYQFNSLPAGSYTLKISAPGFKTLLRLGVSVVADQTASLHANLTVGGVTEAVSVTAPRPTSAPAAAPSVITPFEYRIKIGGNVQAAMIVRKVAPVYPADLRAQGITGTVHLSAIIDKTGKLTEIHVLSGPAGLTDAALDAVSQWQYRPSLLNGEPVAVQTEIDITFDLK